MSTKTGYYSKARTLFPKGTRVEIPKGTVVFQNGEGIPSARKNTVTVDHVLPGMSRYVGYQTSDGEPRFVLTDKDARIIFGNTGKDVETLWLEGSLVLGEETSFGIRNLYVRESDPQIVWSGGGRGWKSVYLWDLIPVPEET